MQSESAMSRELMGKIVDEVFDGAIEDASVIEEIYAAIKRHEAALSTDAEPVAFVVRHDLENGGGSFCDERNGIIQDHLGHWQNADVALYAEPVKTAPAVAVKALQDIASHPADDIRGIAAKTLSALSAQVQDVAGNEDLDENALSLAAQAYQRKFQDMLGPAPTEEPKAGDGPLGYAIRAYLSSVSVKVQDSDVLESNPETLRWWCQQLLDIIENYDISHDAPEEEIALLNDIRAAVDPASPASKHGEAE